MQWPGTDRDPCRGSRLYHCTLVGFEVAVVREDEHRIDRMVLGFEWRSRGIEPEDSPPDRLEGRFESLPPDVDARGGLHRPGAHGAVGADLERRAK